MGHSFVKGLTVFTHLRIQIRPHYNHSHIDIDKNQLYLRMWNWQQNKDQYPCCIHQYLKNINNRLRVEK